MEIQTHAEGRQLSKDKGRDWSCDATRQGMPRTAGKQRLLEAGQCKKEFFPRALRGSMALLTDSLISPSSFQTMRE